MNYLALLKVYYSNYISFNTIQILLNGGKVANLKSILDYLAQGNSEKALKLINSSDSKNDILKSILDDDRAATANLLMGSPLLKNKDHNSKTLFELAIINEKYQSALGILDTGVSVSDLLQADNIDVESDYFTNDYESKSRHYMHTPLLGEPGILCTLVRKSYESYENTTKQIDSRIQIIKHLLLSGLPESLHAISAIGDLKRLKKIISNMSSKIKIQDYLDGVLLCAIGHDHFDITQYLLELGVSPNAISNENIHNALTVSIVNNNMKITELLLEYGANPEQPLISHHTALDYVDENSEIHKKLMAYICSSSDPI